jgi:hypothetical protein
VTNTLERWRFGKLGSVMRRIGYAVWVICMSGALAGVASAQADVRANEWSRGTTLSGFAGLTVDSAQAGPLLGGAVGWQLTPRLGIEGSGSWGEFGHGTNTFAGAMQLRVRAGGRGRAHPFVHAGAGLYRATFGPSETALPAFYERRFMHHIGQATEGQTFTDPTIVGGAGIDISINRHFTVRPDVEATLVLRDRRHHVVTGVAFHAIYHFENHPVTPVIGRQR